MKRALLALVACGGAPAPHPPAGLQHVGDASWGIALGPNGYEVDLVRGSQTIRIVNGHDATYSAAASDVRMPTLPAAPELEQLDRDFAAKSAAEGGSAWAVMFAPDGAEWSNGKRVEQADIGVVMGRVLLGASMEWAPLASGKRGDLGFTLGTYVLASKHSSEHESGSYCTIWRAQPDGSWKVVFDIGSRTEK